MRLLEKDALGDIGLESLRVGGGVPEPAGRGEPPPDTVFARPF